METKMFTAVPKAQVAEIRCVNKHDRPNPHERITHVGGNGWKLTQEDAIGKIERHEWDFYVTIHGTHRVRVEVGVSRYGHKYLRTEGDSDERNNLLSLPECA
jgi:hypothetical protein